MNRSRVYVGLDVHKETIAVPGLKPLKARQANLTTQNLPIPIRQFAVPCFHVPLPYKEENRLLIQNLKARRYQVVGPKLRCYQLVQEHAEEDR